MVAHRQSSGGSSPIVGCVLNASGSGVDAHDVGQYLYVWTSLWDDVWNEDTLDAIPAGLGLDFSFDGSDPTGEITTTEDGTWAFNFSTGVNPDATWKGSVLVSGLLITQGLGPENSDTGSSGNVSPTMTLPAGTVIAFKLATQAASTAMPFGVDASHLSVSRLG